MNDFTASLLISRTRDPDRQRISSRLARWLACALAAWLCIPAQALAQGGPVLSSVDDLVRVDYAPLRLNRATNTFDTVATLTNVSGQTASRSGQALVREVTCVLPSGSGIAVSYWPDVAREGVRR